MATDLLEAKSLIEYNRNDLEENEDEKKEAIDIEFIEQKKDPDNDEIAIDFRWSDGREEDEEDITKKILI